MSTTTYLKTNDFSVSQEDFELRYEAELDLLSTFPKPDLDKLGQYYASEDYISHTDSKRTLVERLYHTVRKIAIKDKWDLVKNIKASGRLLDLGAGTGNFLASNDSRWDVVGVEPNDSAREIAQGKGVPMYVDSAQLADHSFDIITMWHVLEHVWDYDSQIIELKRLLKPDGHLIIAVPNYKSDDASYYGKFWAAYDVPRHLWHFSQTSIKTIFGRHGYQVSKVLPMKFDAFYVSLLSEKYKNGNSNMFKAMIRGLKSNLKAKKTGEYSSLIYIIN